ncbi:MAG: WD40/YVTN/BNR-like repeat-containing protein [Luminiphilus sp.]
MLRGLTLKLFSAALATGLIINPVVAKDDAGFDFNGLKWRNLGPAFMSGRISDIDWDPEDSSVWYVAAGSGGVWKTENAGVSWTPIFDNEVSYSIGNVTVDPSNPNTIWVGTGEDVGGRHVGFGDGIYRSDNGGTTWTNMGLNDSQHISTILVHPNDSKTLFAAVQGPLWTPGGERGLYKTTDGGQSWKNVLSAGEWTGVTDVVMDPTNPAVLYAATWQHHRTVAAYMGGGPESGVHKSVDGGDTWQRLSTGLPSGNMGKIGLAISQQDSDVVYAAIELNRREGGVWRSDDGGASWSKGADAVGGGTGPHYYQEIFTSPHHFDWLYLVGPTVQKSTDGGKTFTYMEHPNQHGDMHAIVFDPADPDYIMMGTDGGVYESFDLGATWRYMENLPLTQYYKLALDDAEPFYNIYGGTQDNNTQGGPSRTDNVSGIRTADWFVILGGDGHQPATEPGNPDIVYAQSQQGNLTRVDRKTGETVYIQPQSAPGEDPERHNWDAPILVSPHKPTRLYFASQRVWKSEDRGDSWTPISGDLTRNEERFSMPIMGATQSWDSPWDMYAMSNYNSITSLAESPLEAGLLYAGTDDGLIHVSQDDGGSWRSIEVGSLPGVPDRAFINDIRADLHDADTVYVALDNHKYGDFSPYLLVSKNRGRSWKKITSGIPDRHLVWRLVQDHVRPELMFAATEFGVFATFDAGKAWHKLSGGMPTISIRDIQIQRRENDLVAASFGRGFFVMDDYTALRDIDPSDFDAGAALFAPRDAYWYFQKRPLGYRPKGSQGDSLYLAENPPFGSVFTYYLADSFKTQEQARQAGEAAAKKAGDDVSFPGWRQVTDETREQKPDVMLVVHDNDGNVLRRVSAPNKAGLNRVAWDLRRSFSGPVETGKNWRGDSPSGFMVMPGSYQAKLVVVQNGVEQTLAGPVDFNVKRLREGALPGSSLDELEAFTAELNTLYGQSSAVRYAIRDARKSLDKIATMIERMANPTPDTHAQVHELRRELYDIEETVFGNDVQADIGGYEPMNVSSWLGHAMRGVSNSSYGPTPSHKQSVEHAKTVFEPAKRRLDDVVQKRLPALREALRDAGAPWTVGEPIAE